MEEASSMVTLEVPSANSSLLSSTRPGGGGGDDWCFLSANELFS